MTPTATKLITAKEFANMPDPPDGSRQELVRGIIVNTPAPSFSHGHCKGNAGFVLSTYAKTKRTGRATFSVGFVTETDPDTVRGPDVAFWSAERVPLDQMPEGYPEIPADLCVEILSPSNRWRQINDKIREYFTSGVKMVWIIEPERRTVTIYRHPNDGRVLSEDAILTVEDLLPGFSCPVSEFFVP